MVKSSPQQEGSATLQRNTSRSSASPLTDGTPPQKSQRRGRRWIGKHGVGGHVPTPLPRRGLVVNEDTVANPRRQLSARHAAHLPPPTSPRAQTKVAAAWPAPAAPGGGCRASWQLRVAYPRLYTWRGRAGARSPLDAGEAGQVQVPRRRRRPLLLSPPPGAPASPPFVSVPDHPLPSLCLAVGAPAHPRCGGQPAPSLCGGC